MNYGWVQSNTYLPKSGADDLLALPDVIKIGDVYLHGARQIPLLVIKYDVETLRWAVAPIDSEGYVDGDVKLVLTERLQSMPLHKRGVTLKTREGKSNG